MRDVIQVERAGGTGDAIRQRRGAWPGRGRAAAAARGTPGRQRPGRDRGPPGDVAGAHPACRVGHPCPGDARPRPPAQRAGAAPRLGRGDATGGAPGATAHAAAAPTPTDHQVATSTAVGYFALKSGLAVGHRVSRGDVLGWVDVLGVRQEIVSPADGVIGRFVTEPGDPVEYGQELVALIAASGAA